MSKKKPSRPEDPFASIPPREDFEAFPAMSAFPENAIAFLTGKNQQPGTMAEDTKETPSTKPVSQPAAKQLRQPESRSVKQTALNQTEKPIPQPISPSLDKPVNRDLSRPAPLSATPSTGPSNSLTTNPATSPSQSPVQNHTETLPQSSSPSPKQSPTVNLSQSLSLGHLKVADRLNPNQRRVLDLLLAVKPYIIKFRDIATALDMREASVRTILRRLEALSFLSFQKARDGNIQGVRVAFNQQVIEQYQQDQTISQSENLSQSQPYGHDNAFVPNPFPSPTQNLYGNQPVSTSINPSINPTAPLRIERIENLSIQGLEGWDDGFLELMWPRVHESGFRLEQVRQACLAREKLGKPLDRELIALSLDRAEWELEEKGHLTNIATDERVRNVAAYIFTALARWGALRAHPQYVSREEKEAAAATAEIRRRKEAAENLEVARFERYVAGLTKEELEAAMQGFPGGSKDAWLKNYWRKHGRDAS